MESWADFDFGWIFGWLDVGWIWFVFVWIRANFCFIMAYFIVHFIKIFYDFPRFELRFYKETKVLGSPRKP